MRRVTRIVVVCAGGLLAGCAAPKDAAPAGEGPVAAPGTFTPASIVQTAPERASYRAMGEASETLGVERKASSGQDVVVREDRWWGAVSSPNPGARMLMLHSREDGGIELVREENHSENVLVEFEPALLVYPATLAVGEVLEQRVKMTVHPLDKPDRVQAQGEVTHSIRAAGTEWIDTGRGKVEATKMVSVFEADLGGPQVRNETQEWLAPGLGVVARKKMERTTLLGVRIRANSEWWVLE